MLILFILIVLVNAFFFLSVSPLLSSSLLFYSFTCSNPTSTKYVFMKMYAMIVLNSFKTISYIFIDAH